MALITSLAGRVRNTSLPKSHELLPLLEAVVNGMQAIDTRFSDNVDEGRLSVRIQRSAQGELDLGPTGPGRTALRPIVGFSVEDNGVGFTPENMTSFQTLDTDFKAELGCRGVGRLLWLKAFDKVAVRSAYKDATGTLRGRQFRFSVERKVEQGEEPDNFDDPGAVVRLDGFSDAFQQSAPKTVDAIAREMFEHCIWYFLRPGGAPEVTVADEEETVSLRTLMDDLVSSDLPTTTIDVKGETFDMVNLRLKSSMRNPMPRLSWCAAHRVVFEENVTGKVPGLYGRLKDEASTEFTYVCYLSGDFLDAHVRADRTDFDISERVAGTTMEDGLSLDDIRSGVLDKVEKIHVDSLAKARDGGRERVNEFVSNHAPRYRPVLSRLESLGVTVDPSIKDQDLELLLHRNLQKLETDAIAEGQEVFAEAGSSPPEDYAERLSRYLDTLSDINQSDLAAYVSRRRAILDILVQTDPVQRARQLQPRRRDPLPADTHADRFERDRIGRIEPLDHRRTARIPRLPRLRQDAQKHAGLRIGLDEGARHSCNEARRRASAGRRRRDASAVVDRCGRDQETDEKRRLGGQGPESSSVWTT